MSELKAIESATAVIEKVYLVYRKSEADKVIKEKDKEIDRISEQALDTINWQAKMIRYQKYKRCLAMANYWGLVSACTRRETQLKCMRRELKWHKLAEKFKEAK